MKPTPFVFTPPEYAIFEHKYSNGTVLFQAKLTNSSPKEASDIGYPKETYAEALQEIHKHRDQVRIVETTIHTIKAFYDEAI